MKNYQKTNYPKLFKNTYWGDSPIDNEFINYDGTHSNRDDIAEKFCIKNHIETTSIFPVFSSGNFYPWIDHIEFYRLKDGRFMLLNSPYIGALNGTEVAKEKLSSIDFIDVLPVYCMSAQSMVMFFLSKKEIRKFFEDIDNV